MPPTQTAGTHEPAAEEEMLWRSWDEFFASVQRARGRAAQEQPDGLTISQYRLLRAVTEAPAARIGTLAAQVGASPPTVTRMLSSLENAGIIRRERLAADRRASRVELTAKGRKLLERKQEVVSAKRRALYESLSRTERRQAERLLRRLAEAIEAL